MNKAEVDMAIMALSSVIQLIKLACPNLADNVIINDIENAIAALQALGL